MIKHVVCFKFNDIKDGEKAKEVLLSMKGNVPEVIDVKVALDELHSERSFDLLLEVLVDSWDALKSYQQDKYHCEVVKAFIHNVRKDSIALDFEV